MPKIVDGAGVELGTNNNPLVTAKLKKAVTYGTYYLHSGNLTVLAAAHGATVGFIYFYNPVASGKIVRIVRLKIITGMTTALATPTAPRITVERGTFTGNPSGAVIPVAKGDSTDVANVAYISAASTGATNGALIPVGGKIVDANSTGTVNTNTSETLILPEGEDTRDLILRPGEYLVVRQADAGTASDTRKAVIDVIFEEYI
jgi:hypothetical protein